MLLERMHRELSKTVEAPRVNIPVISTHEGLLKLAHSVGRYSVLEDIEHEIQRLKNNREA